MTVALLLLALAIETYFIIYDVPFLGQDHPSGETPPIADLVSLKNTVRVQDPGALLWGETAQGQKLHQRQSVLTLERSRAEIAMLDGSGIEVEENSLITLERVDESGGNMPIIRIHRGGIRRKQGASAQQLDIRIGTHRLVASPEADLRVMAGPEGLGAQVVVDAGKVEVDPVPGSAAMELKAGQELSLGKGAPSPSAVRSTGFSIQGPAGGDVIETDLPQATVKFDWMIHGSASGTAPLEVEVSQDPTFQSGVSRLRIAATEPPLKHIETKMTLPAGKEAARWHWRVRPVDGGAKDTSRVEQFWIKPKVTESEKALPLIEGDVGEDALTPPRAAPVVAPAPAAPTPKAKAPEAKKTEPKPVAKPTPKPKVTAKPVEPPQKAKKKKETEKPKAKAPAKPARGKMPPPPPDDLDAVILPKSGGKK